MKTKNLAGKYIAGLMSLALVLCFAMVGSAQDAKSAKEIRSQKKEGEKLSRKATKVVNKIVSVPDKGIPKALLEKAKAIGVFPGVVKAGFIVGGRVGKGVVSRRTASGWSAPTFYNIGGSSFGAQIGAKKTDYIMLFMTDDALEDLLDEKLEFGGSLSFAAGPVGRDLGAATNPTLSSGILVYSRSKGLFAGATIGGAVITANNSINTAFYNMNGEEVLGKADRIKLTDVTKDLRDFSNTVNRHAR